MRITCWDEFSVPFDRKGKTALVGLDLGAGNCSSAAIRDDIDEMGKVRPLYFDPDATISNLYTSIAFSGRIPLLGKQSNSRDKNVRGPYTNFKRPPGDSAKEHYDGLPENPAYEELMRRFFQEMVQKIFDSTPLLQSYDQVILFVGRPASDRWCNNSVAYQQLLTRDMDIKGYNGRIDVMVCSEAQAALAYEYNNKNIARGETVLIIDCGCSTFDAVLVKDRRIIGEYSRQLGAGQIEELMYAAILAQGDDATLQDVKKRRQMVNKKSESLITYRKGYHVLKLREMKEQYFGTEGTNGDRDNLRYGSIELPSGRIKQDIDDDFMKMILETLPVVVEFSYTGSNSDSEDICYHSFVDATRDFLQQTKTQICTGHKVDRVILTGGASVMPFISDQVCSVFGDGVFGSANGIAQRRTREPAFSVGKGLAFMGCVEHLKRSVLEDCMNQVRSKLDYHSYSIRQCVTDAFVNAGWNKLVEDLKIWKDSDRFGKTFLSGVVGDGYDPPTDEIHRKIQAKLCEDKSGLNLNAQITDIISNAFEKLFGSTAAYSFRVDPDVVLSSMRPISGKNHPLHTISYSPQAMLGPFFPNKYYVDLSPQERQKYYDRVCSRQSKVREALNEDLYPKTRTVTDAIIQGIIQSTQDYLTDYLEDITPFFVEKVQTAETMHGGYL